MPLGAMLGTRRRRWLAGLVAAIALPIQSLSAAPAAPPPPPTCATARTTPSVTEGPFYKAGSPERASLVEPGMAGTRITVAGYVLSAQCRPIAGAWLDFWQADERGQYDNTGYRLRGHQFTNAAGAYSLETVLPGLYPGRTRHIHVKVRAPNGPTLTTQLYFPGEPRNQSDGIFNPGLVVTTQDLAGGPAALFNFVVATR